MIKSMLFYKTKIVVFQKKLENFCHEFCRNAINFFFVGKAGACLRGASMTGRLLA
jgi:hypothetical protein